MKASILASALIILALSGCSEQSRDQGGGPSGGGNEAAQMSYGYTFRFTMPGDVVTEAQDRHIAMCDQLGAARCQMQEMRRSAGPGDSDGSTRFVVASGDARKFGQDLIAPVTSLKGTMSSRDFEAEDVSTQIADAQAKAAEKGDATNRATLTAARNRVVTSSIWVYYAGKTAFGQQIGAAFGDVGETMGSSIVALIYFLSAILPWALAFGVIFFVVRAIFRRMRTMFPGARGAGSLRPDHDRSSDQLAQAPQAERDKQLS